MSLLTRDEMLLTQHLQPALNLRLTRLMVTVQALPIMAFGVFRLHHQQLIAAHFILKPALSIFREVTDPTLRRLHRQLQKMGPVLSILVWKVMTAKQLMRKVPSTLRRMLSGENMS